MQNDDDDNGKDNNKEEIIEGFKNSKVVGINVEMTRLLPITNSIV